MFITKEVFGARKSIGDVRYDVQRPCDWIWPSFFGRKIRKYYISKQLITLK